MIQPLRDCACGGQADLHGTQKTTGYYWVQCIDCKSRTKNYENRVDAENAWNDDNLIDR